MSPSWPYPWWARDCAMATVSVKVHVPVFAKVSKSVPVTV